MTRLVRQLGGILAALGLMALAGCESGQQAGGTAASGGTGGAGTPPVYLIGPGDELNIIVFGHPDLSGNFVIDNQGDLTMPLIGRMPVRGKTVDDITAEVTAAYGGSFLVDPRVSVELLNSRPFYIYGQVNEAGEYPYVRGITVRQAIAIAGGFTQRADTDEFVIYRQSEGGGETELNATADSLVLPGDTVEVLRRLF